MELLPKDDWFMLPHKFVENYAPRLSYSAFKVWIILRHLANRFSSETFFQSDEEMSQKFGMTKRTMSRVRKELKSFGLIDYKIGYKNGKNSSKSTTYKLLPDDSLKKLFRIKDVPNRHPIK